MDHAIHQLIEGYRRFRQQHWPERRDLFERLAEGQKPHTTIVTCVDSRVDPAMLFNAAPGEIFTIRNVANIVPPYAPDGAHHSTSAALEFAVRILGIPRLIVMGHGMCGGIQTLITQIREEKIGNDDFISSWINIARPACTRVLSCTAPDKAQTACEQETVRLSLANLKTFPWIAEKLATGALTLTGGMFNIKTGKLEIIDETGTFQAIA